MKYRIQNLHKCIWEECVLWHRKADSAGRARRGLVEHLLSRNWEQEQPPRRAVTPGLGQNCAGWGWGWAHDRARQLWELGPTLGYLHALEIVNWTVLLPAKRVLGEGDLFSCTVWYSWLCLSCCFKNRIASGGFCLSPASPGPGDVCIGYTVSCKAKRLEPFENYVTVKVQRAFGKRNNGTRHPGISLITAQRGTAEGEPQPHQWKPQRNGKVRKLFSLFIVTAMSAHWA